MSLPESLNESLSESLNKVLKDAFVKAVNDELNEEEKMKTYEEFDALVMLDVEKPPPLVRFDDCPSRLDVVPNENGDLAFDSSCSAILDFFSIACGTVKLKDIPLTEYDLSLDKMWKENPLYTLKMIFYKRDCRGGQGEKRLFLACMNWLYRHHRETFLKNLQHVPFYGSWKDLRTLSEFDRDILKEASKVFTTALKDDLDKMEKKEKGLSLAAKWLTVKGDDLTYLVGEEMGFPRCHVEEFMRKKVLSPLKRYLEIVECKMSSNSWSSVNYSRVPSIALHRYNKTFKKRDPERFGDWIKSKDKKINVKTLHPYQVVQPYINGGLLDPLVEEQWKEIVKNTPKGSFIPISDTSSSMSGLPMEISIAMGILLSRVSTSHPNTVVSFNTKPTLTQLKGETLFDDVQDMKKLDCGGSTDLDATYRLILTRSILSREAPETLILFTDGQFNMQVSKDSWDKTAYERMKAAFELHSLKMPRLVFWNLRGDIKTLPVTKDEIGTVLVSGFSASILSSILDNKLKTPMEVMKSILDNDRYSRLTL